MNGEKYFHLCRLFAQYFFNFVYISRNSYMQQYKLYKTRYENFDLLLQESNFFIDSADFLKLVNIRISPLRQIERHEFEDIEEGFSFNVNKGLNYKFVEIQNNNGVGIYYVAENNSLIKRLT